MKKTVTVYISEESITYSDFTLEEFLKKLNDAKDKGATHIGFDCGTEWDSTYCNMQLYLDREETDQEYSERLAREEIQKIEQRKRDEVELKRLLKKLAE